MQNALVFLALIALTSAAKSVQVNSIFNNATSNTWGIHQIEIWNSDNVGSNYAISNVVYEVLVAGSDNKNERLGIFYGYGNLVGQVGSIMGNCSGIGTFYVIGDAGTYNLQVVVYYSAGSSNRILTQNFQFNIGTKQVNTREVEESSEIPEDAVLVEKNEDFSLWMARDGSNNDLGGVHPGVDNFAGEGGTMSWNTYYMAVGPANKLYNVAVTYSANTTGWTPSWNNPGLNGTSTVWAKGSQNKLSFGVLSGYEQNGQPWVMNIGFTYNRNSATGTAGSWTNSYPVNISGGSKREVRAADQKSIAQSAFETSARATKLGYIFSVAGAAVAVVAAVAIVAALFTIRKNRQAALISA